ncbi:hypothetical protein K438DRAFT_1789054 [Mycena galopus ATCC 62051]|nr:hypothetical protein K438DRAFT_1789054 [Mycena galopus ATCC 62051]
MSEQQLAPPATPVTVKPTNFLFVKRDKGSIWGTYVIDPCIKIPQSMLPPLAAGETEAMRHNLLLHTSYGNIDIDLFVLGDADTTRSLSMVLKCEDGSITAKFQKNTTSVGLGNITLHLPRTFRGPVTVRNTSEWAAIHISEPLTASMMPLSEVNGTWRYFVGTLDGWTDEGEWAGDEMHLESTGDVRLHYDVEPDLPGAQHSSNDVEPDLPGAQHSSNCCLVC